jgi:hypothetical protein
MTKRALCPGRSWRTLAHEKGRALEQHDRGTFDELVIDSWFHLEQMTTRNYWIGLCGLHVGVRLCKDGTVNLSIFDNTSKPAFPAIEIKGRLPYGREWWQAPHYVIRKGSVRGKGLYKRSAGLGWTSDTRDGIIRICDREYATKLAQEYGGRIVRRWR